MTEKIKPVGWLKTTRASKTHIPGIIRRETDVSPGEKIPYIINARSVLLYDPKLSARELIDSLDVMKQDILLRKQKKTSPSNIDICGGCKYWVGRCLKGKINRIAADVACEDFIPRPKDKF